MFPVECCCKKIAADEQFMAGGSIWKRAWPLFVHSCSFHSLLALNRKIRRTKNPITFRSSAMAKSSRSMQRRKFWLCGKLRTLRQRPLVVKVATGAMMVASERAEDNRETAAAI